MHFLLDAVAGFLAAPAFYWTFNCMLLGALVATARWPATARGVLRSPAAYAAMLLATPISFRAPIFFCPVALNPDEAQMSAQAIKSLTDVLPWRGFDGTTSGPIDSYALLVPHALGFAITLGSAHAMAAFLAGASCVLFYVGARQLVEERCARAGVLIPVTFLALTEDIDFVHYSSEHVPMALLAAAFCGLCFIVAGRSTNRASIVAAIALGFAPFAKLQALPMTMVTAVLCIVGIWKTGGCPHRRPLQIFTFVTVLFASSGSVIAATAAGHSLHDAYISYVLTNVTYTQAASYTAGLTLLFSATPYYQPFALGLTSVITLVAALLPWRSVDRVDLARTIAALALLFSAIYAIEAPHRDFPHYLLFALFPASALATQLLGMLGRTRSVPERSGVAAVIVVVACVIVPTLIPRIASGNNFVKDLPQNVQWRDPAADRIRSIAGDHARMSVWGWMPQYYVYAQATMATKDAHTYYEIVPGPYRAYFRRRYMDEMLAAAPAVFVDAVAPGSFGFTDRVTQGFETFPELRSFIAERYDFASQVGGVRIYTLRRRQTSFARPRPHRQHRFTNAIVDKNVAYFGHGNHPPIPQRDL